VLPPIVKIGLISLLRAFFQRFIKLKKVEILAGKFKNVEIVGAQNQDKGVYYCQNSDLFQKIKNSFSNNFSFKIFYR